jgi:hypothetical protein
MNRLCLAFALLALPLAAGAEGLATVSLLKGQAFLSPRGDESKKQELKVGAAASEGDAVTTGEGSLLELTLPDRSVIRVAPSSRLLLEKTHFEPSGARTFSARLLFGSVWSKVSTVLGGDTKFEVKTDTAVAGVRGTTFRVDASRDRSAVVSVFAGSVAVAGGPVAQVEHKPGERREKPPPREVNKAEWERLVLAMMKVKVSSAGEVSEPEKITEADLDDFAKFNQTRDGQ